ncbi:YcaO-like family protein [Candidatus Woesearchaeota archaeon]|nr:YcaO-like family protein [Candidatus Woesearchaeota archaeon]
MSALTWMRKLNEHLLTQQKSDLTSLVEQLLVLPITGKLQKTRPFNDEPKFIQYFCLNEGRSEEDTGSGIFFNDEIAKLKALAETVERSALGEVPLELPYTTYLRLGCSAVNPFLWHNYSQVNDLSTIQNTPHLPTHWTKAKNLLTNQEVLVPTQLVYVPYTFRKEELMLCDPVSTGAAFGTSWEDAVKRGILECVERDAFMIRYFKKDKVPRVTHPVIEELSSYFARYQLELNIFDLTNDLDIPVMLGIVIDKTGIGPAVSAGLKVDENPLNAALGAMLEAQHVRSWIRFSYHAQGKPQIHNPSQIIDLKTRGFYWYDLSMIKHLDFLLENSEIKEISGESSKVSFNFLLQLLKDKEYHVFGVDISPEIPIGTVAKVLIPELQPLRLVESPDIYTSKRLYERGISNLNSIPHPFT